MGSFKLPPVGVRQGRLPRDENANYENQSPQGSPGGLPGFSPGVSQRRQATSLPKSPQAASPGDKKMKNVVSSSFLGYDERLWSSLKRQLNSTKNAYGAIAKETRRASSLPATPAQPRSAYSTTRFSDGK